MKTSFEDHLKEDRLGLEGAMSAAPAKIVASVFKILNSRILVGEMIALDQWELLPIWELPLPDGVKKDARTQSPEFGFCWIPPVVRRLFEVRTPVRDLRAEDRILPS